MIRPIREQDVQEVACLAAECFLNDSFYVELATDPFERTQKLISLFSQSIRICMKYGYACGLEKNGSLVAFSLWFDYGLLKKKSPDSFSFIFPVEEGSAYSEKIYDEWLDIDKWIGENTKYLYLLAIGVKEEFRRRGFARELVGRVIDALPQYNLFSDISNRDSVPLYEELGFEVLGVKGECTFVRYLSRIWDYDLSYEEDLKLLLPADFMLESLLGREVLCEKVEVPYLEPLGKGGGCFKQSIHGNVEACLANVSYAELLIFQRVVNVLNCQEVICKNGNGLVVYYVGLPDMDTSFFSGKPSSCLTFKENEWRLIPDVYISIPVSYGDIEVLKMTDGSLSNSLIDLLLCSLAFRTEYEAGIPVKDLNECGFKERICRFFLGFITVQILSEDEVVFYGKKSAPNKAIGSPVRMALVISIDCMTNLGVLHLISMSSAVPVTQILDSVSRNQLNVVVQDKIINLYQYLKSEFQIEKMGMAKSFLSLPYERMDVSDDLLASILFCETYYDAGESLGTVADKEIRAILEQEHGLAQYNYASVYAYTNVVVQMSPSLAGSVFSRIAKESITLFYVELILFEEASIQIANERIVSFLTHLDEYTPDTVLRSINEIISDYVQSIEFWDIQMNYPSSKKSVDDLRTAFKIKKLQELIHRNKELLLTIYQTRSDIIDRKEAAVLSAAGIVLAGVSSVEAIVNCGDSPVLYIILLFMIILLVWKQLTFKKLVVRKTRRYGR